MALLRRFRSQFDLGREFIRIPRDMTLFSLFRDELAGTLGASAVLEGYDVLGERVL